MPEDIKKGVEDPNKKQGMDEQKQGFPKQGGLEQERTGRVGSTEKQGGVNPEKKI